MLEASRVSNMLNYMRNMIISFELSPIDAIGIVGNLVDLDKDEAENDIEKLIFCFIDKMSML